MKITFKPPSKELSEAYAETRSSKGEAYAAATVLVEAVTHGKPEEGAAAPLDTVSQRCKDLKTKEGAAQLAKCLADLGKTTKPQPRKKRKIQDQKTSTSTPSKEDRGK